MKNLDWSDLINYAEEIKGNLKKVGLRVDIDARQNYTPGWKFNHWEQKGVPIRIEVGPRDLSNRQCRVVRRDNMDKTDVPADDVPHIIPALLDTIHTSMYEKAKKGRDEKLVHVTRWEDFVPNLEKQCLVLTPFCDLPQWEDEVKKRSRDEVLRGGFEAATSATSVAAKTLCKPFDQPPLPEGTPCFVSGLPAVKWVLWGRSY